MMCERPPGGHCRLSLWALCARSVGERPELSNSALSVHGHVRVATVPLRARPVMRAGLTRNLAESLGPEKNCRRGLGRSSY